MTPSKGKRLRMRSTPKGRPVDIRAREEVLALLADAPRRRDLLIEFLHLIQDRFGCLSAAHLVALAAEMKMAMAEVYEVATFYHHFDVVKEATRLRPPSRCASAIRLRASWQDRWSCFTRLPRTRLGGGRRCSARTFAWSGHHASAAATPPPSRSWARIRCRTPRVKTSPRWCQAARAPTDDSSSDELVTPGHIDYAAYRTAGGYALAASCVNGERTAADVIALMEDSGPSGSRGRRLPRRPQVEDCRGGSRSAPDGDQHRRRRAGHVQGPLLPRARSASLSRRRHRRGVGRRHR